LTAWRDRAGDDLEYVGGILIADALHDLRVLAGAFSKK
jgi:hypothetical protein